MTAEQLAQIETARGSVIRAAKEYVREMIKQRPTKELRTKRARLERFVLELNALECQFGGVRPNA